MVLVRRRSLRNGNVMHQMHINGLLYPSGAGGSSLHQRKVSFAATSSRNVNDLPTVTVTPHFQNPRSRPITHSTVSIQTSHYLVVAFYDPALDVNPSLNRIGPVKWRGAVAVFSLGKRVTLHKHPKGPAYQIRSVVRTYLKRAKEAIESGNDVPSAITCD